MASDNSRMDSPFTFFGVTFRSMHVSPLNTFCYVDPQFMAGLELGVVYVLVKNSIMGVDAPSLFTMPVFVLSYFDNSQVYKANYTTYNGLRILQSVLTNQNFVH